MKTIRIYNFYIWIMLLLSTNEACSSCEGKHFPDDEKTPQIIPNKPAPPSGQPDITSGTPLPGPKSYNEKKFDKYLKLSISDEIKNLAKKSSVIKEDFKNTGVDGFIAYLIAKYKPISSWMVLHTEKMNDPDFKLNITGNRTIAQNQALEPGVYVFGNGSTIFKVKQHKPAGTSITDGNTLVATVENVGWKDNKGRYADFKDPGIDYTNKSEVLALLKCKNHPFYKTLEKESCQIKKCFKNHTQFVQASLGKGLYFYLHDSGCIQAAVKIAKSKNSGEYKTMEDYICTLKDGKGVWGTIS